MKRQTWRVLLGAASGFFLSFITVVESFAGGYGPPLLWSARYNGTGGAAISSVKGPEALYFNPAALSALQDWEISINGAGTLYQNEGPVLISNQSLKSSSLAPAFGVFLGKAATPRLGLGLGVYTAGQLRSSFENVDVRGVNAQFDVMKPLVQSSFDFTEVAVGGGYAVTNNFSVGAAWRILIVRAALAELSYTPDQATAASVEAIDVQDVSATRAVGFRLGARYTSDDYHWGLGIQWRNKISFNASARANAKSEASTAGSIPADAGTSDVLVSSIFPQQLAIGGHVDPVPLKLRLSAEWEWTHYGVNREIRFTGTANGTVIPNVLQEWRNQQALRFGAALQAAELLQLRAGYVFSSQVIPDERANIALGAPGPSHTISGGLGTWLARAWSLDLGVHYTIASGDVNPIESIAGTQVRAPSYVGTYNANSLGFYAGLGRRF